MADILIVDDQDRYIDLLRRAVPEHRYLGPARSWAEARDLLARRNRVDLVLLDVHFDIEPSGLVGYAPGMDAREVERLRRTQGFRILDALRARWPDLPVILMTSRHELQLDDGATAAEDYTYFLDDDFVDARSLQAQIEGILRATRGAPFDGPVFWGRTLAMRRLRQRLEILARGRLPVVLLGPTGTGKSLLARHFVHPKSGRAGRFVAVDLATLPRDLMAAHLFGAVKGAYTGSVGDRPGAFEQAHRGTLFLDEVGNLSADAQKMLLSVLQEGVVTRLGDLRERAVDVKVVVATNEDLAERVRAGSFRADLYMRLNPATAVRLPPLSERRQDLEELLRFAMAGALRRPYLREMVDDYRAANGLGAGRVEVSCRGPVPDAKPGVVVLYFPDRSLRLLRRHPWPGNLREFAMVVENAALLALAEMAEVRGGDRPDVIPVRPRIVRDLLTSAPPTDGAEGDVVVPVRVAPQATLNKVSQHSERQIYTHLYLQERGDFGAMARILLGSEEHARKVQLRFNQLGLKVRELKARLR